MQTAYIAMGANLPSHAGPPEATLAAAASRLKDLGRLAARSSLYLTEPVGLADQPRFTNAVIALETGLAPAALLDGLLNLERAFGRNRAEGVRNGPRSLDLDILLMGDITLREPCLEIPHPRLAERAFVLVPLNEIAPHAVDPVRGKPASELLAALAARHQREVQGVRPIDSLLWSSGAGSGAGSSAPSRGPDSGQPHDYGHR
jgi:2-amino-4-hydroxy-6-hydroxymethyldihydropteridine diphosphokinase